MHRFTQYNAHPSTQYNPPPAAQQNFDARETEENAEPYSISIDPMLLDIDHAAHLPSPNRLTLDSLSATSRNPYDDEIGYGPAQEYMTGQIGRWNFAEMPYEESGQCHPPFTDKPIKEARDIGDQYAVDSYSLYAPLSPPADASYPSPPQRRSNEVSVSNPPYHPGSDQKEYPFSLGAFTSPRDSLFEPDLHPDLYGHAGYEGWPRTGGLPASGSRTTTPKRSVMVQCEYCTRSLLRGNLRRHIEYSCREAPRGVRRERQGQGEDVDVASLGLPGQHSKTPDISLGGRIIRLVMYGNLFLSKDAHRAWVHRQTKFSNVTEELLAVYQIDATESLVVLEAYWGPRPYWIEAHPDSSIGEACQALYVIFKSPSWRYILGVVRDSLTDFPICISISNASAKTISECVMASHSELTGRIKSITDYASDEDVSDYQLDNPRIKRISYPNLRTVIIITLDKPPDKFMASPLSHIYSLWQLSTHQTELSYKPIPSLLQVPLLYCEHHMQQAYALDTFALQMIHITGATRHLIISLANEMKTVFGDEPSGVDAVLAAEGNLADLLQVAPLLSRQLKTILDRISRVIERLQEDSFNGEEPQNEIDAIFVSLCGEFPGAVTVRHSYTLFKRLGSIDRQENQALDRHDATSPEMIQRNLSNEHGNASGSHYGQDADHEMVDSVSVGRTPARRRGRTHIGQNDEDMVVDLDGSERESE